MFFASALVRKIWYEKAKLSIHCNEDIFFSHNQRIFNCMDIPTRVFLF